MIDEICHEEQIETTWFSDDWFVMLEQNGKRRYVYGHTFDLNSTAAAAIAQDKCATYSILSSQDIPAVEHQIYYEQNNTAPYASVFKGPEYLQQYFEAHHRHIVVKPNQGSGGGNVYQLTSLDQAEKLLDRIFHQGYAAALCPFYDILHEYRVILLDGELQLAYQKTRGADWRFNLAAGATAEPIPDPEFEQQIVRLAQRAAKTLNLRFTSVDVIQTRDKALKIIEVNAGVMIDHYIDQHPDERDKVKDIYRRAVRKMFANPSLSNAE